MNRLTTIASTGLLMKMSVNFIVGPFPLLRAAGAGIQGLSAADGRLRWSGGAGRAWLRCLPGGRHAGLAVLRLWRGVGRRLDVVVDRHFGLVAQLEQAAGGHPLAGLQPFGDRDQVAAGGAGADEIGRASCRGSVEIAGG